MRVTRVVVLALVLSVLLLACGGDDDEGGEGTAAPETPGGGAVTIADSAFDPEDLEVPAGTTVAWTNTDGTTHSVVSASALAFESEVLGEGDVFTFAFDEPGEYDYVCGIHSFMTGTITVQG